MSAALSGVPAAARCGTGASAAYSLRRRLFWRLLGMQSVVLLLVTGLLFGAGWITNFRSADATIELLREAVVRAPSGRLELRPTAALEALRRERPDLWFVIREPGAPPLVEGEVPREYARIGTTLDEVGQARFGWTIGDPDRPTARMRWAETAAGRLQFLTGTDAPANGLLIAMSVSLVLAKTVVPIVLVMALGALIATPLVVGRSLAGIDQAAAEADAIAADDSGSRLSTNDVPREILPLVKAVNRALGRRDDGIARQQRFLAGAAHELRTPVAILSTRVGALPDGEARSQLMEDTARLAILTEQMLDLQRLSQGRVVRTDIDLGDLARKVALDMSPLVFAAGYTMRFDSDRAGTVRGDAMSLQRALMNVVQNAVDHGGRRGEIRLEAGPAWLEVSDEGPGIPREVAERVFEPFYKHHQNGRGAGLGLHLVRDIMRLHGGDVTIRHRDRGVAFRLAFGRAPDAG